MKKEKGFIRDIPAEGGDGNSNHSTNPGGHPGDIATGPDGIDRVITGGGRGDGVTPEPPPDRPDVPDRAPPGGGGGSSGGGGITDRPRRDRFFNQTKQK